jgi:hypothetical protein
MTIHITDHALLRYLDLVQGIAVEPMRDALAARFNRVQLAADKIGGGDYLIRHEGHEFVVRGGLVVTVFPPLSEGARFSVLEARG